MRRRPMTTCARFVWMPWLTVCYWSADTWCLAPSAANGWPNAPSADDTCLALYTSFVPEMQTCVSHLYQPVSEKKCQLIQSWMTLSKLEPILTVFFAPGVSRILVTKSQLRFLIEPAVNLLYLAVSHSDVNDVSPLRHPIDRAVDQWRTRRLRACVKTKAAIILNICYRAPFDIVLFVTTRAICCHDDLQNDPHCVGIWKKPATAGDLEITTNCRRGRAWA